MDDPRYVLIKLNSGETIIGKLIDTDSTHTIDVEHPYMLRIVNLTNPFGTKIKDVLIFKKWIDFSDDVQISIFTNSIASIVSPNPTIINFYNIELSQAENSEDVISPIPDNGDDSIPMQDFNFEDFNPFNMLKNMGSDGEMSRKSKKSQQSQQSKKKSKSKKRTNQSKQSFDIAYDPSMNDPLDPRSWSDNPSDYF